ncbi:MAG: glycosyltransferase family 4 protein [Candidatus Bathyarchaeota archaeon]|nr:glycosyltransferase family 4 protein [Candidatus Bathyarchaeum sp.]
MNIHYLTLTFDEGNGGFRVITNVLNGLVAKGHDVTITSMLPSRSPFMLDKKIAFNQAKFAKRNLFVLGLCRMLRKFSAYDLDGYAAIRTSVSKWLPECDLNIAHSYGDVFPIFESNMGVPFHYMQHDELVISSDPAAKAVCDEAYNLPIKRLVNSIWLHNNMKERYGYDLPVVNPAINHKIFFPRGVNKKSDKRIVLCFGGRQLPWKGFNDAIHAMKLVNKHMDNVEFWVYGRKPIQLHEPFPHIFYTNPSDEELADLYRTADVTICPSWFESFPLPPLEAMACGSPTVTTRFGTEDYAFDGKNALVVPPRSPKSLADAIIRLLKDEHLSEYFRKEGPKTANQFTWDKTVDNVEQIFRRILN